MAIPVLMPKQGITVESCILTKWFVKVGDAVKVGDLLFSFETDKSAIDFNSEVDGEVLALFCSEGDEVPVLTNVCVIGKKGEDVSAFAPDNAKPQAQETEEAPAAKEAQTAPAAAPANAPAAQADGRVFASPRAKNLAAKLGVSLSDVAATGPNGRIIERDVRAATVR